MEQLRTGKPQRSKDLVSVMHVVAGVLLMILAVWYLYSQGVRDVSDLKVLTQEKIYAFMMIFVGVYLIVIRNRIKVLLRSENQNKEQ